MGPLTRLVFEQAIKQSAAWRAAGQNIRVSVNVSASDLADPGLTDLIVGLLKQHGQPTSSLIVEITETSIISDFERCRNVVQRLRDLGVSVSIDDFGAGFTSLAYLSGLAVEELKIDRALITPLASGDSQQDIELVRATIALGHALRLRVIAEGIEDNATLDLLWELGCDLAQGFLISEPKPAHELSLKPPPVDAPAASSNPDRRHRQLARTA